MKKTHMTNSEIDRAVKIQGTEYDRKRKMSDYDAKEAKKKLDSGWPIEHVADYYDVSEFVIRNNTDDEFRKRRNAIRDGKHYGTTTMGFENRVEYKRALIQKRISN